MNYNSPDNYFTCPCDGYLRVNSWSTNSATIYTVHGFDYIAPATQQSCLFLKKGCRVYCIVTGTAAIQIHFFACKSI